MSMIRNKQPDTIATSAVAERWDQSPRHVRRVLVAKGARRVQLNPAANSKYKWNRADVLRVERELFGGLEA